jgi:PKD repeat protein
LTHDGFAHDTAYTATVTAAEDRAGNPMASPYAWSFSTVAEPCDPVETVTVEGPASLLVGETGVYSATYAPITATLPVTLTWEDGTVGATAFYSWTLPGTYTLSVTATNPCGEVSSTFSVAVCQPVEAVTVEGPAGLGVGETGVYTAAYAPLSATLPVTLTWGDGTVGATAVHSWTLPGTYTLGVTATNPCGEVSSTFSVAVCQPVEAVTVEGPAGLGVGETGVYTAAYAPLTATLPVSLTWDNGTVAATAVYSWTLPGIYTLTVTATNPCGEAVVSFPVEVSEEVMYRIYLPLVLRDG